MADWKDIGAAALGVAQKLAVMNEKFERQAEEIRELRTEWSKVRDELTKLTFRVQALEEARKTTEVEVKSTLSNFILEWQNESLRRQLQEMQGQVSAPKPTLSSAEKES